MASATSFVNSSRTTVTAFLNTMAGVGAMYNEFMAQGAQDFIPPENDPYWNGYDMTRLQVVQMYDAISEMLNAFNGEAVPANINREKALFTGRL